MADLPISSLPAATTLDDNDEVAVHDTGTTKRITVGNLKTVFSTMAYSAISADTNLAVNTTYIDTSTADRSHTLPLLSGTTAGDRIPFRSGANGVKVIKHHASDSTGAPLTVLFMKHDYVEFISTGSAWVKGPEKFTGRFRLDITSQNGVSSSSEEKVFDTGYNVDWDTTGQWDDITNHRYDHPSTWPDVRIIAHGYFQEDNSLTTYLNVNGTDLINPNDTSGRFNCRIYHIDQLQGGQNFFVEAYNNDGGATRYLGTESYIVCELVEWIL